MTPKKIIGIICIVAAICLLVTPYVISMIDAHNNNVAKDELLNEIEDIFDETQPPPTTTDPVTSPTEENTTEGSDDTTTEETTQTETPYKPYRTSTNEEVDGILYIPSIDLELPILTNVTKKGLNKTCARVTNTGAPGCNNYCIMGHVMKNYGYIFNRLHEVRKGDIITVKARTYTYNYRVTETFVTEGLDMDILEDVEGKQIITVFCCSYQVNNGRLVVRGELESIHYN